MRLRMRIDIYRIELGTKLHSDTYQLKSNRTDMASSSSCGDSSGSVPEQYRPEKSVKFPKRKFGKNER